MVNSLCFILLELRNLAYFLKNGNSLFFKEVTNGTYYLTMNSSILGVSNELRKRGEKLMLAKMNDVIKRYGDQMILENLSFTIRKGEILGLLGPNGAGKTTTIHSLCGLLPIDSGEISIFGQKQSIHNRNIRRAIGLVTQEITVCNDLTVVENLRYFGSLYGLKKERLHKSVAEVLAFVGLEEHAKKKPKALSGGMQRRLNIGCALVHKPKLLIMDEPTVGIDPQSRNHILEAVKKIAASGTTVVYTTHYMEEVQTICDRIIIMDSGKVIAEGTMQELVKRLQHEERVRFVSSDPSPMLQEKIASIAGVKSVVLQGNDYLVTSSSGSGNIHRIMEIAQQDGAVSSFTEERATLEDVFLTLTGKSLRDGSGI